MKALRFLQSVPASAAKLWKAQETLSLKNIRIRRLPYLMAFPLAMVFANKRPILVDTEMEINGVSADLITFLAYITGVLLVGIIASERNIAVISKVASIVTMAGFIPWIFLPDGMTGLALSVLVKMGIGGCMLSASFSFAFALNNAERFFASALILLLTGIAELSWEIPILSGGVSRVILMLVAAGIAVCAFFHNADDFQPVKKREKFMGNPTIWLMLFIFLSYFLMKFTGMNLPEFAGLDTLPVRTFALITAVVLCFFFQMVMKQGVWTMCNLFFVSSVCAYALSFADILPAANAFFGLKEIGLFVVSYLVGGVSNKFLDFRGHKQLFLLIMAAIAPMYIVPALLAGTPYMYPAAVSVSAVLFAAFLLLSPALSRHLFLSDWIDDFKRLDMTESAALVEKRDTLENLGLTPREKQVVTLLLQGLTFRQIGPELGIAFDTVRSYGRDAYRKLNVNSRSELFVRFGVAEVHRGNEAAVSMGKDD